jgi:hypothetical protein
MSDPYSGLSASLTGFTQEQRRQAERETPAAKSSPVLPAADQTREDQIGDPLSGQSRYDFNYKAFPNDLGTDYARDYMIININVPVRSDGKQRGAISGGNILSNELSTVDRARTSVFGPGRSTTGIGAGNNTVTRPDNPVGAVGAVGFAAVSGRPLARNTRRIAESIAIFMPSGGLVYNYQNKYEEISMTALGGKVAGGILAAGVGALTGIAGRSAEAARRGASSAGAITDPAGRVISQAALLTGFPINPRVEVLFSHNDLRQFRFDFLMSPRNVQESETIKEIIRILRLNSVPEIDALTAGFTYIPPAEFDISIYHNNAINPHIPRINTCVLTVIEVQYDPTDGIFSTFSNGHPVAVRMTLGFQEVEPLHKTRINQGF